jgi:hypothetical protein
MKSLLTLSALVVVSALTPSAFAEREVEPLGPSADGFEARRAPLPPAPVEAHPTPRLELSYQRFSAGNVDGSAVPLEALHLDLYFLSWRWLRAGLEAEAGRGHATLYGGAAALKYGTLGLNAGLQLPGRITPFVEGRLDGGLLHGQLEGPLTIPGSTPGTSTTLSDASATTYLYARGLDAGAAFYLMGRAHLTLSLGWLRSTWGSADYRAALAGAGLTLKDVTHDSFLLKVGLGI